MCWEVGGGGGVCWGIVVVVVVCLTISVHGPWIVPTV